MLQAARQEKIDLIMNSTLNQTSTTDADGNDTLSMNVCIQDPRLTRAYVGFDPTTPAEIKLKAGLVKIILLMQAFTCFRVIEASREPRRSR